MKFIRATRLDGDPIYINLDNVQYMMPGADGKCGFKFANTSNLFYVQEKEIQLIDKLVPPVIRTLNG